MVRACCETSSWTCNNHYGSVSGLMSDEYREEAPAPMCPMPRMGWCGGGGMRGGRKEAGWRTMWRQLRRGTSLSCRGIDCQMGHVWRADPRHDTFNSAWASPARSSCRAWAVASARSGTIIFFILQKSYIHMYTSYSILKRPKCDVTTSHSVSHPSSIRVWVQTPPPTPIFNILR
jgi:hypothetical protein